MRLLRSRYLAPLLAVAAFGNADRAWAQADVNPPLPNVMLLVDNSGSMEYKTSSATFPQCTPTTSGTSEKSRWIDLVEVLSGTIQDYRCNAVDRTSGAFNTEFSLSGVSPYDYRYPNPYHRPLSGTCTPGPNPGVVGALSSAPYSWPAGWLGYHDYSSLATACTTFGQSQDGLLDAFKGRVRFGLMTFDSRVDAGTGVSGGTADFATGNKGLWSYYVGSPKQGMPAGCAAPYAQEVGARNAAAPPWEGRMVPYGSPTATSAAVNQVNQRIQDVLLASRPYGATPIAGLLHDSRDFHWNDTAVDPNATSQDFGPYRDPFIGGGCRSQVQILLTDGEPNLDLRPFCEGAGGQCPFETSEDIARDLATSATPNRRIKTFVIGFAVSDVLGGTQKCSTLSASDLNDPSGLCATNPDKQLQVCCRLSRIAYNGGTDRAYFPSNREELRQALSDVLSTLTPTTSRTLPVFASGSSSGSGFNGSFRFYSSFTPKQFDLWSGVLERQRYQCQSVNGNLEPVAQNLDRSKGDDFIANVNTQSSYAGTTRRRFYSYVAETTGAVVHSERTIRPSLTTSDGLGVYGSGSGASAVNGDAPTFVNAVTPAAMSIDSTTCAGLSATACRDKYLKWDVGLNNGDIYHRCPTPGSVCNLVGDIHHSTPQTVGIPQDSLRDETYTTFVAQQSKRPLMLYTSTNDGFLHAFKVAVGDPTDTRDVKSLQNNELWAFVPPAVLPRIPSQYPGVHLNLLDGVPVIRDVVATKQTSGAFRLERAGADVANPGNGNTTWRTILVQSFGGEFPGYFALDVTDPVPTTSGGGPKFLWQLTTGENNEPLFGTGGPTPLITTLFIKEAGSTISKEVAVAVLPGGSGGSPTGASCTRKTTSFSDVDSSFPPRTSVNCYPAAAGPARSLTVVRLDSGEILRTFRQATGDAPASISALVTAAPIDSPITGIPVAFPAQTGAVADRVFVGDQDGTLWRVDVSDTDPANWTMKLFFDAYSGGAATDGQPIATRPVISVDVQGDVTVAMSTGDQEVLTASNTDNYVWSLTENLDSTGLKFVSKANWFTKLTGGERVAGPMTLFNSALYFSTFAPEAAGSSNVCRAGTSRVWGVDYLVPRTASDLSKGGKERLPDDPNATVINLVQFIDNTSNLIDDGATIFGVGVAQLPTCNSETVLPGSNDYLGHGSLQHTQISNVNPGKFQLVMHTGSAGTSTLGGSTNVVSFDLATPPSMSRIGSWAAALE